MNLPFKKKRLGEILMDAKVLTDSQLGEALRYSKDKGVKLGEALIELNILTEDVLNQALSKQLNIEIVTLNDKQINQELVEFVGEGIIRQHKAVPFYKDEHEIRIAVSNPLDIELEDKIYELADGLLVKLYLANVAEIEAVISRFFEEETNLDELTALSEELYGKVKIDISEQSNNPIIQLSNQFFRDAVMAGASDVHINPEEDKTVIQFRQDGVLRTYKEVPKYVHGPLVIRIKNSAGLDFTKTNIPQDGRTTISVLNKEIDLRIATVPTTNGEKITIRLLDKTGLNLDLSKVGFTGEVHERFLDLMKRKAGIILITGETGSGKSSLCYAMLHSLNDGKKNILTVEDPVEYELDGVSQVHINEKAGLDFPKVLRSFLRHDPNIILVGEIRDFPTVEIAIRAAITGHLVLSTLHTNSSAGTVSRLADMGVERHLIAESIIGIINQRLVPTICSNCKESYDWEVTPDMKKQFDIQEKTITLYRGSGKVNGHTCDKCGGTGSKGRMPIQELLQINEDIGDLIKSKGTKYQIEELARKDGFMDFKQDGWQKTKAGFITLETLKGEILFG